MRSVLALCSAVVTWRDFFPLWCGQSDRFTLIRIVTHVNKRLFARVVLGRDREFIFLVFTGFFYYDTLDAGVFSDLWLSVDCAFIMNCSYGSVRVIRRCFFRLLHFAMGANVRRLERNGMYMAKNAVESTFSEVLIGEWYRRVDVESITDVGVQ